MIVYIIAALLVFGILIAVHELGHFLAAKACGVRVNEFAIGMGPKLLHFRKGETTYSLRLFPIGGFCSMEGEDQSSENPNAFEKKAVWRRMLVVLAGAFMNLVLGFVLITVLLCTSILSATDLIYKLQTTETDSYDVTVKRDGARVVVENVKFHNDNTDGLLDFAVEGKSKNPVNVVTYAAKDTAATAKLIWMSLVELVSGKYSLQDLSGPVGTVSVIEQAASSGENLLERVQSVMNLTIFITVNVGVFNLLPIPGLDGSRFVFLLIEAIRRKPVPKNREAMVHLIGMAALFLLMILVTVQDITRFFR